MSYQDQGGGVAAADPGNGQNPEDMGPDTGAGGGGTGDVGTPDAPKPQPIRVPGQDLPDDVKRQKVSEQMSAADQAIRSNNPDGAIQAAQRALEVDETAVPAMIMLGHAYFLKGYDDKSEAILDIAKKNPEGVQSAKLWMIKALIADRAPLGGREDEALANYEKATQRQDSYMQAWFNRGAIYLKRKRYADAIVAFEKVTTLPGGGNARAHTNLGSAYRGRSADKDVAPDANQRDTFLRKAENEFKTAMTQQPQYAPAYFNLGLLYLDADPYPGMEIIQRFDMAMRFLNEYKRVAGPAVKADDPVEEYLAYAQKQRDKEQKKLDIKRKKDAAKKAKDDAGAQPSGGNQ